MSDEDMKVYKKVIRHFFWYRFFGTFKSVYIGFLILGLIFGIIIPLARPSFGVDVQQNSFGYIIIAAIFLPLFIGSLITHVKLKSRLNDCFNSINKNEEVKTSVGDYFYKKTAKRRYGYKYFYITSLHEIGDTRFLACLITMLKNMNSRKKAYAVNALQNINVYERQYKDEQVLKTLEILFHDKKEIVRDEAKRIYDSIRHSMDIDTDKRIKEETHNMEDISAEVPVSADRVYSISDIQMPDYDCVKCPSCNAVQRNNRSSCFKCGARFIQ